jgi:peptidoglycan/xylan/chitin deacetylase (PgdA/CDA1 family)
MHLDRGVFTLSLDFELIWGTRDLFGAEGFRAAVEIERRVIVDRLLELFAKYGVRATWCIVGHLFLDKCQPHATAQGTTKHPEIVPPRHPWFPDWFKDDPCTDEATDPLYYGRALVEKVRACRVPQDIGSHSFSHVIFSDPGCSRETARSELAASVRAAGEIGIAMRSFVFPRNAIAHLDLLRDHGFTVYRGIEPSWYNDPRTPEPVRRVAHLADILVATEPPVVMPEHTASGLWNVPASMLYFPSHGIRRHIPVSIRVKRAIRGLDAAVKRRRVFHLWFHPTNLAENIDAMFDGLERIFQHARRQADAGELDILPMIDVPAACHASREAASAAAGEQLHAS